MGLFGNQIVFKHIEIAQVSLLLLLNQSADSFPNFQSVTEEAIWTRTKSQIGTSSVCETFDQKERTWPNSFSFISIDNIDITMSTRLYLYFAKPANQQTMGPKSDQSGQTSSIDIYTLYNKTLLLDVWNG